MEVTVAGHMLSIAHQRVEGDVSRAVQRYLEGERIDFSSCTVDLSGLTGFQQQVVEAIRTVPYGDVVSYGELAERIRRPDAVRAVANACGANPVPIIVPCHRVVAENGIGGYSDGGAAVKRALLRLEGTRI